MATHGASQQALMAGMAMGFAPHPRTILNHKKELTRMSPKITVEKIDQAIRVRFLSHTQIKKKIIN